MRITFTRSVFFKGEPFAEGATIECTEAEAKEAVAFGYATVEAPVEDPDAEAEAASTKKGKK